jgi:hypothetical protein
MKDMVFGVLTDPLPKGDFWTRPQKFLCPPSAAFMLGEMLATT